MTLIETVVALTLLALVLLLGLTSVLLYRHSVARLEAQREALYALEATVESLRAGTLPLQSGPPQWFSVPPPAAVTSGRVQLQLEVEPIDDPPGLYDVTVTARFRAGRATAQRRLRTIVWRQVSPSPSP